jgi:hypothetical protein
MSINNLLVPNTNSLYGSNIQVSYFLQNVNFGVTGTHVIAQLPTNYSFIPTSFTTAITSMVGSTAAPVISLGSETLSYGNITSGHTLLDVNNSTNCSTVVCSVAELCPANDTLGIIIVDSAEANTYVGDVYVTGFLKGT